MKISGIDALVLDEVMHHAIIVQVETDEGINGYGEVMGGPIDRAKWIKHRIIGELERYVIDQDPTNVERVMLRLRHHGGYKPLGRLVSGIENALWDIAGKAAGLPVYKLLGGKIRDKVRIYCDCGSGVPMEPGGPLEYTPEAYGENARRRVKELKPYGFSLLKFDIGYHGKQLVSVPGASLPDIGAFPGQYCETGHVTELGLKTEVESVKAVKEVIGEEIGLCLDCGPGQSIPAAIRLAKALEPYNVMWAEDLLQGTQTPGIGEYTDAEAYKILTRSTSTPTLTGEHVYLRYGFMDLIQKRAISIVAPDIMDVGGLAEIKWIAEFAEIFGVLIAPHCNGLVISFMCNVHAAAAMPKNFIAFEWHRIDDPQWADTIKSLEGPFIKNGFAIPPNKPGLGFELNEKNVRKHLAEGETYFGE
ncbi:MAG: mandelate racemase/muconate lactonizing enzyme family protein [Promethearchaeota archaeon]|jgi:L-alanine-DL-glutamate epimerase-like enolase superfamily enzyme